jgi:hypothetical protein
MENSWFTTLKQFCTYTPAGKIMPTMFWDLEGTLLVDSMSHMTTITGDAYAAALQILNAAITIYSH